MNEELINILMNHIQYLENRLIACEEKDRNIYFDEDPKNIRKQIDQYAKEFGGHYKVVAGFCNVRSHEPIVRSVAVNTLGGIDHTCLALSF